LRPLLCIACASVPDSDAGARGPRSVNDLLTFKRHGEPETTGKPLHYTMSGLDDVYLFNGFEIVTIDSEEYVTVHDLDGLWKAIGLHLVRTRKMLAPRKSNSYGIT